jgi:hypothetical protein
MEFVSGVRTTSLGAIVLGSLLALVFLAMLETLAATDKFFDLFPEAYVRGPYFDTLTGAAYQLHRYRNARNRSPSLILLGGSSLREALSSDEVLLEDLEKAGIPLRPLNLAWHGQTIFGSLAVTESLPKNEGLLLIAVSPYRLNSSLQNAKEYVDDFRLVPPGPESRRLAGAEAVRWPNVSSPQLSGWLRHLISVSYERLLEYERSGDWFRLKWRAIPVPGHRFDETDKLPPAAFEKEEKEVIERHGPDFLRNRSVSLAALRTLISLAKQKGYRPILLETPFSPRGRAAFESVWNEYSRELRLVSRETGTKDWDFFWKLNFADSDFRDFSHILPSQRQRFQESFVNMLLGEWPSHFEPRTP